MNRFRLAAIGVFVAFSVLLVSNALTVTSADFASSLTGEELWVARPLHFAEPAANYAFSGYSPAEIRAAYHLPSTGGEGTTIAIIVAYDAPTIQSDLTVFCQRYNLPLPSAENFEVHQMASKIGTDSGWASETALDVEWARAIAPQAKILLVEAPSPKISDMLDAIDYARNRPDVVSISMSWGDDEFSRQALYNSRLTSTFGAVFFAASGDNGAGVLWPASSSNVVAVGGTTLSLNSDDSFASETAWSKSGGGISAYETQPDYQTTYGLSGTKRSIPDVAYNADPEIGFSVYSDGGWYRIGGTSAGAPQWAAIHALNQSASNTNLYQQARSAANATYFRDITSGSNGAYTASTGYDLVTGLGSPLTSNFAASNAASAANAVTLVQADQSTPLDAQNQFEVSYLHNGLHKVAYASNGTLTVMTDPDSNLTINGVSIASSDQEKWVLKADGSSVTGSNLTLYYYNLVAQTVNYAVVGGGSPPNPVAVYETAPLTASEQQTTTQETLSLNLNPQTAWVLKGAEISVSNPLFAGTLERWITQLNSSRVQTAGTLSFVYSHQYALVTSGTAQTGTQWYDSGETATVEVPGVVGRSVGVGYRITSYSLDNNAPVAVEPTLQTTSILISMDMAHNLELNSVRQYQVSIDDATAAALVTFTPPTISQDNYWYDEGTQVTLKLNGVINQFDGTRQRVSTVTVNGASANVAAMGTVTVVDEPLFSAKTISTGLVSQYQLSILSGSVNSVAPQLIGSDTGWYDEGTAVTVTFDYSWNITQQSRLNAVSYQIGQEATKTLERNGNGTFAVEVTLKKPQTVTVSSITQYQLKVAGRDASEVLQQSPTGDGFFDAETTTAINVPILQLYPEGTSRNRLVSYTLDDTKTLVPQMQTGNTTVAVTFDKAHQITFETVEQFLVQFQFTDQYGKQILPSSVEIETPTGIFEATQSSIWIDSGTQLQIHSVSFQNADVKPNQQVTYAVNKPVDATVQCRVFNAKLSVEDYLGFPISDAQVAVTLVNQTTIKTVTSSDGTVSFVGIPVGTFQATATYMGVSTTIQADASVNAVTVLKVFLSTPMLVLIIAVVGVAAAIVGLWVLRRNKTP